MATRLDGLNAGVFGVPEPDTREAVGARVRAGQVWHFEDFGTFTTYARVGPFWMGRACCEYEDKRQFSLLPMKSFALATLVREDAEIAQTSADAGMMR